MDTAHFSQLIEDVDRAPMLVVIDRWMGADLRASMTAEDLLQETLLMACRDREQHVFRDLPSFRGWLLQIARHRLHDAEVVHSIWQNAGRISWLGLDAVRNVESYFR